MRKHLKLLASTRAPEFERKYAIAPSSGPACAICQRPQSGRKLARDHCHASGIRLGELCSQCNTGLGLFQDDPNLLAEAARYLVHYGKKLA